jgi:predicted nucleic acid-binding Zn ribbon protein
MLHTPRNRRGDAQPVGEILAADFRTSGLQEKLRSPEVYECWPEVAGDAAAYSRVVGFNKNVLYIEVDSAPQLHLLSTFRRRELLAGMQLAVRGMPVKDIRFRVGGPG